MKTITFFNNKGGVGKTSLVYHLAWMFSNLGLRVVAIDLDPQSNLTSMCVPEDRLESLWAQPKRPTIFTSVEPLLVRGTGDIVDVELEHIGGSFALLLGDLALSSVEDELSQQWPQCSDGKERAFRVITAFDRVVRRSGQRWNADIILIDIGPNLGAINRSALIASDHVVVPLAPDLFSIQGLENMGPKLVEWRKHWAARRGAAPLLDFDLAEGKMAPLGYVISRHTIFASGVVKAFQRWLNRAPEVYARSILGVAPPDSFDADSARLAQLKDYRSLMPMAQEARKPMFMLKPADGAIGGHQQAVRSAYDDFSGLAKIVAERAGISIP